MLNSAAFHVKLEVDKHVVKKNRRPIYVNKRTGKVFVGKDAILRTGEENLLQSLRESRISSRSELPLRGPLWGVFIFTIRQSEYFTKKGIGSKRLVDTFNLPDLVADCLQKAEIIENDRDFFSYVPIRIPAKTKEEPNSVEIAIFSGYNEMWGQIISLLQISSWWDFS